MGRVMSKKFARYAQEILNKYRDLLTDNFEKNKKILSVLCNFPSKHVRNRIAGYITRKIKKEKEE